MERRESDRVGTDDNGVGWLDREERQWVRQETESDEA